MKEKNAPSSPAVGASEQEESSQEKWGFIPEPRPDKEDFFFPPVKEEEPHERSH